VSWLSRALEVLRSLLDAVMGNPGQVAAEEKLRWSTHELERERRINASLRQRLAEKEARIRELEKLAAERDPGALLDSVFRDPGSGKPT
jgi:hypothetical protein